MIVQTDKGPVVVPDVLTGPAVRLGEADSNRAYIARRHAALCERDLPKPYPCYSCGEPGELLCSLCCRNLCDDCFDLGNHGAGSRSINHTPHCLIPAMEEDYQRASD